MHCKVSIIVPVYNVENYIEKCIESILNQEFNEFELILINDGSTDNSGYICDRYANLDSRVKVIHQNNSGQANARNKGLEVAKGEYIGFVDSDDYIEPSMYKYLYQSCVSSNADISIAGLREVDENGNVLNEYIPNAISLTEIFKRAYPWNKLFRKSLFNRKDLYFESGKYYEDLALIPKLYIESSNVSIVSTILYNYLKRRDSTTGTRDYKIIDNLWAYTHIKSYLISEDKYEQYKIEFEEGVKYFKKFYSKILYDFPTKFLIKNRKQIIKYFNYIDKLTFTEYAWFIFKHIIYCMKKIAYNIKVKSKYFNLIIKK